MVDKSIAKSIYDKVSKDDRSIMKMVVDYFSNPDHKNKSIAKMIVDLLSNNPGATVTKKALTKAAKQAKSAVVVTEAKKAQSAPPKPTGGLATRELNKAERDTLERNIAKDKRLREENKNIDKALSTSLPAIHLDYWDDGPRQDRSSEAKPVVSVTRESDGTVINARDSSAPPAQLKAAKKYLEAEESDKPFGEKAGKEAIQNFFQTTFGYTPTVSYDFPTEEEARGGMKRGGKVKKTKSKPTKKYAMNRGGKVTSVRKPNRA